MISNQVFNWLSNRREHNKVVFWEHTQKGLQADKTGTINTMSVYVPGTKSKGGRMINPYAPFVGTWNNPVGMGVKKRRRGQGLLLGKNSPFNSIPILGTIL